MSSKSEAKKDNINKIKNDIENTRDNVELTNKMIDVVSDSDTKKELEEKNERRLEAIDSMIHEIKSEVKSLEVND